MKPFMHPNSPFTERSRYLLRNRFAIAVLWLFDLCAWPFRARGPAQVREPERILVSNWAHLGDVLLTFPAIAALKQRFPRAQVDMVAGSWSLPLLREGGLINRIHVLDHWLLDRAPRSRFNKLARYVRQFAQVSRDIRAARYDLSVDFYAYFPNTTFLMRTSGVPVRVGFNSGGGDPLLTHAVAWDHRPMHMSRTPLALLKVIDASWDAGSLEPVWPGALVPPPEGVLPLREYVLVHTGTGDLLREWPETHWQALLERLVETGSRVVLVGAGAREIARAERLARAVPDMINLCGRLSWSGLAYVVRSAKMLVCLESAPCHLASAFSTPTVCLFGSDNAPVQWGPRSEYAEIICAVDSDMNTISVDTVFNSLSMLGKIS